MKKKKSNSASSAQQYGPRIFEEIMNEVILNSEMPFYAECRRRHAMAYPNTEPGVDLKLMTREPGRMDVGQTMTGMITRDGNDHFLFVEKAAERRRRGETRKNPCIFNGKCINVRSRADGTLYVTLNRPAYEGTDGFVWFCRMAAQELTTAAEAFGRGVTERLP